jgi:uncharacterized protein YebE (UPF0316 family)
MVMELFLLCIKIFFVRILDVSLGTVRTVMTVKGKTLLATIIGFIEVTIWFLVVKDALSSDSNSMWIVFSYAGGFALGTYLGGVVSKNYIRGKLNVQIIVNKDNSDLVQVLRDNGYAVSVMKARGYKDSSKLLLFMEIDSFHLSDLDELVKEHDEKAFMVVNETKYVQNGHFRDIVK